MMTVEAGVTLSNVVRFVGRFGDRTERVHAVDTWLSLGFSGTSMRHRIREWLRLLAGVRRASGKINVWKGELAAGEGEGVV